VATASVAARAALAGNPSDGYGGAVTSIPVPTLAASAEVGPGDHANELVRSVLARWTRTFGSVGSGVTLRVDTSIPRSVGLAGSSAIVIAGLRALARHTDVVLDDEQTIQLAHSVEREDLGIPGGWQDQLSQTAGCPVAMEFTPTRRATPLVPGRRIPFFVAWDEASAEPSGVVHAELSRTLAPGRPDVDALAAQARLAARAFEAGDVHALKSTMEATLELRFEAVPIADRHREMAEVARSCGVPCNFTGSGGAIVGVLPKSPTPFLETLTDAGLQTTTWEVG